MDIAEILKQGKQGRFFRSTRKLKNAELVSHITQRAAGRDPLFIEDNDYLWMLGLLKDWTARAFLDLYAFCLMPNHIHLLFSPQKDNLYDAMRDLFSQYARYFNRKYERKGHLFGGPYRQSVVLNETYLLAASLYIHLNPVRAGLAKHPLRYRWSSSRLYLETTERKSFVNSAFILGLIAEDPQAAQRTYRTLLQQAAGIETGEVLEEEKAIQRLLENLQVSLPEGWKKVIRGPLNNLMGRAGIDDEELARALEALKQKRRIATAESRRAKQYVIDQLIARGFKRHEIAEWLGVSVKTLYNYLH